MKKIFTKKWFAATAIRMIRTFAQAFLAAVPTTAVTLGEVNWLMAASTACVAAILSFVTALAGLPEVPEDDLIDEIEKEL